MMPEVLARKELRERQTAEELSASRLKTLIETIYHDEELALRMEAQRELWLMKQRQSRKHQWNFPILPEPTFPAQ